MDAKIVDLLLQGTVQTLTMTFGSVFFSYLLGIPLGVILYLTDQHSLCPQKTLHSTLGFVVNFFRSVPFIILFIWILPFTRFIVGTALGVPSAIVPLVVAATPFVARMVESSLKEVGRGVIEAAQAMGSSVFQIVYKVLLVEAKPSLVTGCTIVTTTILGYTTIAGFAGAGGLGDIAIRYGYHRYQIDVMNVTVLLLVVIVQILQIIGVRVAKKSDKRVNR